MRMIYDWNLKQCKYVVFLGVVCSLFTAISIFQRSKMYVLNQESLCTFNFNVYLKYVGYA